MNVNDVICVGAEPLAMLDYIAIDRADPEVCEQIGVGLARGASWPGSRSPAASWPSSARWSSGVDVSGACFGTVALDAIVDGSRGAARRLDHRPPLLRPPLQRLHAGPLGARRARHGEDPKGASAGRSARRCWSRPRSTSSRSSSCCAPRSTCAASPTSPPAASATCCAWRPRSATRSTTRCPCPPLFDLIQERGNVADEEMHDVFNMGCGFCVVVAARPTRPRRSRCCAPTTPAPAASAAVDATTPADGIR